MASVFASSSPSDPAGSETNAVRESVEVIPTRPNFGSRVASASLGVDGIAVTDRFAARLSLLSEDIEAPTRRQQDGCNDKQAPASARHHRFSPLETRIRSDSVPGGGRRKNAVTEPSIKLRTILMDSGVVPRIRNRRVSPQRTQRSQSRKEDKRLFSSFCLCDLCVLCGEILRFFGPLWNASRATTDFRRGELVPFFEQAVNPPMIPLGA